ncbi:unnamed protein product, partial [Effrenium voratum]
RSARGASSRGLLRAAAAGIDFDWFLDLTRLFERTKMPTDIWQATAGLKELGVDVDELAEILDAKRKRWEKDRFLQDQELPEYFMDFALALHTYTLKSPSVYSKISRLLNDPDRRKDVKSPKMRAAMTFVKFMDVALGALPEKFLFQPAGEAVLYRGVKGFVHEDLEGTFEAGTEICWYTFKSMTSDKELMRKDLFCGQRGKRMLYLIRGGRGKLKSIQAFSRFPEEKELLGRPLQRLMVARSQKRSCEDGDPFVFADSLELKLLPNELPRSNLDAARAWVLANQLDPKAWLALAECGTAAGWSVVVHGRNQTVLTCLERALALDARLPGAWRRLADAGGGTVGGRTYSEEEGRDREAALDLCRAGRFLEALEVDLTCDFAWSCWGVSGGGTVEGRDYSEKECYLRSLELNPKNAAAWTNLGSAGGGTVDGRDYSQKECYLRSLELNPKNAAAWNSLGCAGGGTVDGRSFSEKELQRSGVFRGGLQALQEEWSRRLWAQEIEFGVIGMWNLLERSKTPRSAARDAGKAFQPGAIGRGSGVGFWLEREG